MSAVSVSTPMYFHGAQAIVWVVRAAARSVLVMKDVLLLGQDAMVPLTIWSN